jgi:hypothetical protein
VARRSIDFCIPYIATGLAYLEHLVDNLLQTAADPRRIHIFVSYHTDADLKALLASRAIDKISKIVHAPPYLTDKVNFVGSANHSMAINSLAAAVSSEIVVFSDYDMAFVYPGWDDLLEGCLYDHKDALCGVTYPPVGYPIAFPQVLQAFPELRESPAAKYQNVPNLSFLCIRQDVLKDVFGSRLTCFDGLLAAGQLPFRKIDSSGLASATQLPLGTIQWLDTGYEIPEILQDLGLQYSVFPCMPIEQQKVFARPNKFEEMHVQYQPEFFHLQSADVPFLCHYKKGTFKMKSTQGAEIDSFQLFADGVASYLAGLKQPTAQVARS